MEEIEIKWATLNNGYGDGSGSGDGYGDGSGDGGGSGYGDGSGYGGGYGGGSGYGSGIRINSKLVHNIDNIQTIIKTIKHNLAKGFIVNDDLTLTETYIVKSIDSRYFAHGENVKSAMESLENKIVADLDEEEIIEMFLKEINKNKKYSVKYFFDWHGKLTGSCLQGRESFIKNKNISLDSEIDFKEFIEICKSQYGWSVIEKLA